MKQNFINNNWKQRQPIFIRIPFCICVQDCFKTLELVRHQLLLYIFQQGVERVKRKSSRSTCTLFHLSAHQFPPVTTFVIIIFVILILLLLSQCQSSTLPLGQIHFSALSKSLKHVSGAARALEITPELLPSCLCAMTCLYMTIQGPKCEYFSRLAQLLFFLLAF